MIPWQAIPHVSLLVATTATAAALAHYAWRHRTVPGGAAFALLMLAVAEWALAYALELGSIDLDTKTFWIQVQYIGIVSVPVMWLAFAIQYTGRGKWLTRRTATLLGIVPVVTLLLVFTTEMHGLVWSSAQPEMGRRISYGIWFWVHSLYSYSVSLIALLLFVLMLIRSPRLYRRQAGVMVLGGLVPWAGNILYVTGLTIPSPSPGRPLNPTPFAFTITGLFVTWGLFRLGLLDIVPVAHEAIVASMTDGVIVVDSQNRIVDLNAAAQDIVGRTASDMIGQSVEQIFSAQSNLIERYRDTLEVQDEIVQGEGEEQRVYDLRISPLYDRRGNPRGWLVVLRDITGRKQMERELRQAKNVAEEARLAAEVANQAKSTFLANISHELRTPLSAIIGYSELVQEEMVDRNQTDFVPDLVKIHTASNHLLALIGDLLDLSRIETGRMVLYPETFDLADLIQETVTTTQPLVTQNGNVFAVDCPDDLGTMHADRTKVQQILVNLLGNAAKFTHQGRISLAVAREPAGGQWVQFRVSDTGIGISPEQVQTLFQPLAQPATTTRQSGGSGLGLVISHRFCQMMGGEIRVESEEGRGTTFTVRMPLHVAGRPADPPPPG